MTSSGGGGGAALSFSDRFFSYETFKVLRVRDRRLGGLYRLFQATILLYVASSIIYQKRYLRTEDIVNGVVRVTLKAPTDGITAPDYCTTTSTPCVYWNENDILYEPGAAGALITTRAQMIQYGPFDNQTPVSGATNQCDVNLPTIAGCDPHKAPMTLMLPTSFVADIERFTLMFEHSIRGQASGMQLRSGNMDSGVLRDAQSGEAIKTFVENTRYASVLAGERKEDDSDKTTRLAGDVMMVGDFLKAAGVNLDELSGSPAAAFNETVRSSGVVVIVVIQYAAKGWNPNRISYEYLPKAIPDQEYKVIETIRNFRGGDRVEINRHGVRIVFSQTGQLGQFSLMTLLTNLVAAVALFKVANIIVELLMLRIHPQKKAYGRAKFESTKGTKPSLNCNEHSGDEAGQQPAHMQDRDRRYFREAMDQGSATSMNTENTIRSLDIQHDSGRKGSTLGDMSTCSSSSSCSEVDDISGHEMTGSEESEDEPAETYRQMCQGYMDGNLCSVPASGSMLQDAATKQHRSSGTGDASGSPYRRPSTPHSTNDAMRRQQDNRAKGINDMSVFDWTRNGSSSSLSGDITPGVARTAFRTAAIYHTHASSEDVEIETKFGPIRPNSYKGFNPRGLNLGSPPLSPSLPQMKTASSYMRDITTPEHSKGKGCPSTPTDSKSTLNTLSPTAMQSASPNSVCFGPCTSHQQETCAKTGRGRRRFRRKTSSKQVASLSTQPHTGVLTSHHSSCSLSSLTSSSSLSSLFSSCDGSFCSGSTNRAQTDNTVKAFGIGVDPQSSSPGSFGVHDSPMRGYSSTGKSKTVSIDSSNRSRVHKRRKKECHHMGAESPLRSGSEVSLVKPLFGMDSSSSLSSFPLRQTSSSPFLLDTKGKQSDHSARSFTSHAYAVSTALDSGNATRKASDTASSSSAFKILMTPFQLPVPASLSQGVAYQPDMDGLPQESTSSTSSSSLGKQLPRDSPRLAQRSSVSSSCILLGQGSTEDSWKQDIKTYRKSSVSTSSPFYKMMNNSSISGSSGSTSRIISFDNHAVPANHSTSSQTSSCYGTTVPQAIESVRTVTPTVTATSSSADCPSLLNTMTTPTMSSTDECGQFGGGSRNNSVADSFGTSSSRSSSEVPLSTPGSSSSVLHSGNNRAQDEPAIGDSSSRISNLTIRPISTALPTSAQSSSSFASTTINTSTNFRAANITTFPRATSFATPAYTHPTSSFFKSPITNSYTTTLADTGVRVLRRTITMITADNKKLLLRRSKPLILNGGVGEEKGARM
ncbi:cytochrome c oxidase subunit 1 [Mortierella polycephala]|uniref:Cytochrome c oxidase subunit 1 n=1 Tax=Mortierella polycephala TaxID=41804 RepID=A0A9P6Q5E1_9FUNG|nr:cytochrome c oxidase subunit 1 [Mortierella polycephala]